MSNKLSAYQIGLAIAQVNQGASFRQVGKEFGVDKNVISRLHSKVIITGNPNRKTYSPREKKWTANDARQMKRWIYNGECSTAVDIARERDKLNLPKLGLTTIKRILKSQGLNGRVKVKKPLLTKRHRNLRLQFARKYKKWKVEDWRKVIFSDETRIKRISSDGKQYCWRRVNEPVSTRTSKATVQNGGGGFMIWSCIGAKGVGWACKIEGTMNAKLYLDVLKDEMKSSVDHCVGDEFKNDFVFQQDNATSHKADIVMKYLNDERINLINHPPQSPDLNPIENLWKILKQKLQTNGKIQSKEQLWETFGQAWYNISSDVCKNLIDSMPKRIEAVIAAKGGPTKY